MSEEISSPNPNAGSAATTLGNLLFSFGDFTYFDPYALYYNLDTNLPWKKLMLKSSWLSNNDADVIGNKIILFGSEIYILDKK